MVSFDRTLRVDQYGHVVMPYVTQTRLKPTVYWRVQKHGFFSALPSSERKSVAESPPSQIPAIPLELGSPLLFFFSKVRLHVGTLTEKVNETTESGEIHYRVRIPNQWQKNPAPGRKERHFVADKDLWETVETETVSKSGYRHFCSSCRVIQGPNCLPGQRIGYPVI